MYTVSSLQSRLIEEKFEDTLLIKVFPNEILHLDVNDNHKIDIEFQQLSRFRDRIYSVYSMIFFIIFYETKIVQSVKRATNYKTRNSSKKRVLIFETYDIFVVANKIKNNRIYKFVSINTSFTLKRKVERLSCVLFANRYGHS